MLLTLLSIATDLSTMSFKEKGTTVQGTYARAVIEHKIFDGTFEDVLTAVNGDAAWIALFGTGVTLDINATDGVHYVNLLLGKTQAGATITAEVLSFGGAVDLTGVTHISLSSDPYTRYALDGTSVEGMADAAGVEVLLWYTDENPVLVIVSIEKELAEDIRCAAGKGCGAVEALLDRYMDIMAAIVKFNCADYQGAEWIINPDGTTSTNCGCS
jgi:hypothetical protein